MSQSLLLTINNIEREFDGLESGAALSALVEALGFRPDRVAVEQNGVIVPRARWAQTLLSSGDRLEVVQFVGGGAPAERRLPVSSSRTRSHSRP